jgi:transcriptional regulator NrdR family protein
MDLKEEFPDWDSNWCPLCDKFSKTTVVEDFTHPNDDYSLARIRQRVRMCNDCNIHFETYEMDNIEFHNFALLKENFSRIRGLVNEKVVNLELLKKIVLADSVIEVDDPEIWDKIEKAESETEAELYDEASATEIFSNWDPDLSGLSPDYSQRSKDVKGNSSSSDDEMPPF